VVDNLVRVSKGISFEFKSVFILFIAAYSAVLYDVVSSYYCRILHGIELPIVCWKTFPKIETYEDNALKTKFKLRTGSVHVHHIVAYWSIVVLLLLLYNLIFVLLSRKITHIVRDPTQHVISLFLMARSHYSRPTPAVQPTPYRLCATAYFVTFILSYIFDIIVIGDYFQNLSCLKSYDSGHVLSAPKKTLIRHICIDHRAFALCLNGSNWNERYIDRIQEKLTLSSSGTQ
jgi:hypothetical protein